MARRPQSPLAEIEQVHEQQFVAQLPRQAEQQLQHFHRLQAAEDGGHRSEHAGLAAIADQAIPRRLRPLAAEARTAIVRADDLELSFILIDARDHRRLAGAHRRIVDQELGREVVAAIDDDVRTGDQAVRARRRRSDRRARSTRIDGLKAASRAAATSALGRPMSAGPKSGCRCKFDASTAS